eukprot:GHVR01107309.1.p1 GENE.GHVR01107309.1~~GHVR01107309.1.p1  ORF type:complete len:117 (-),score=35.39 GHVR01107309.1:25-375(-)
MKQWGFSPTVSGFSGGGGGGICQALVVSPCTFIVTSYVTTPIGTSPFNCLKRVWNNHGISGFYQGSTAIALRQASNWASRQGITEYVRSFILMRRGRDTHTHTHTQGRRYSNTVNI